VCVAESQGQHACDCPDGGVGWLVGGEDIPGSLLVMMLDRVMSL